MNGISQQFCIVMTCSAHKVSVVHDLLPFGPLGGGGGGGGSWFPVQIDRH